MTQTVLVTGGTGTLGRVVVERLLGAERDVRVLSRRPRPAAELPGHTTVAGDLHSGEGIPAAVTNADVIVHCATANGKADIGAAQTLFDAAKRAGANLVAANRRGTPLTRPATPQCSAARRNLSAPATTASGSSPLSSCVVAASITPWT